MDIKLLNPEKIRLKDHPELNESRLQDVIAKNPEIIGLGKLILKNQQEKLQSLINTRMRILKKPADNRVDG